MFGKKTIQKTYVDPKTAEQQTVEELTKDKDVEVRQDEDGKLILVKETEYTGVGLLGIGFLIWAGTTAVCSILGAVSKMIRSDSE